MTREFHVNRSTKGRYYMSIILPLDIDKRQSMGTQPCELPEQWNMEEIYPHKNQVFLCINQESDINWTENVRLKVTNIDYNTAASYYKYLM